MKKAQINFYIGYTDMDGEIKHWVFASSGTRKSLDDELADVVYAEYGVRPFPEDIIGVYQIRDVFDYTARKTYKVRLLK